jgi:hypothetical protein
MAAAAEKIKRRLASICTHPLVRGFRNVSSPRKMVSSARTPEPNPLAAASNRRAVGTDVAQRIFKQPGRWHMSKHLTNSSSTTEFRQRDSVERASAAAADSIRTESLSDEALDAVVGSGTVKFGGRRLR